jgi:hypothetical protein
VRVTEESKLTLPELVAPQVPEDENRTASGRKAAQMVSSSTAVGAHVVSAEASSTIDAMAINDSCAGNYYAQRLAELARQSQPAVPLPEQFMPADQAQAEQSSRVTKDNLNDIIYNVTDDRLLPQEHVPGPTSATGTQTVVELMEKGTPLDHLRNHLRQVVALPDESPLPVRLATALNAWLRAQDPKDSKQQLTLKEKRAVTEFVELLVAIAQCNLMWNQIPCRLDVDVNPGHPEGSFRVRGIGESRARIRRARLADVVDNSPFVLEECKPQGASATEGQEGWRQGETARKFKKNQVKGKE